MNLGDLKVMGITATAQAGQLHLRANRGVITPDLVRRISAAKPALLRELEQQPRAVQNRARATLETDENSRRPIVIGAPGSIGRTDVRYGALKTAITHGAFETMPSPLLSAELLALVDQVADAHGFSPEDRAEAKENALRDFDAAMACFRTLVADLPGPNSLNASSDDRRRCMCCANLSQHGRCLAAASGELPEANRSYEPVQDVPGRCEAYAPRDDDPDQRREAQGAA